MQVTLELIARLAVIASTLSLLGFGLSILAIERLSHRSALVERETGLLALVNDVGIIGFVVAGLASAVTMVGTIPASGGPMHVAAVAPGIVLLAVAGFFAVWGYRSLGREFASDAEVRTDTVLVTHGAFGLVRHPMYLSVLLLWAGSALALLSPLMALCWLVLIPAFVARSRAEERLLTHHFGRRLRRLRHTGPDAAAGLADARLNPGVSPRTEAATERSDADASVEGQAGGHCRRRNLFGPRRGPGRPLVRPSPDVRIRAGRRSRDDRADDHRVGGAQSAGGASQGPIARPPIDRPGARNRLQALSLDRLCLRECGRRTRRSGRPAERT